MKMQAIWKLQFSQIRSSVMCLCFLLMLMVASGAYANHITFDTFDITQQNTFFSGTGTGIFGTRTHSAVDGGFNENAFGSGNMLLVALDNGAEFTFRWDSFGTIDLNPSSNPNKALRVDIIDTSFGYDPMLSWTVMSSSGSSSGSLAFLSSLTGPTFLLLSDLVGSADLTQIESVELTFNGGILNNQTIRIDTPMVGLETPEPSTILLLGLGLAGVFLVGRRRLKMA